MGNESGICLWGIERVGGVKCDFSVGLRVHDESEGCEVAVCRLKFVVAYEERRCVLVIVRSKTFNRVVAGHTVAISKLGIVGFFRCSWV